LIAYRDITGQSVQPVFQKKSARGIWMHALYDRLARDWYISQKQLAYGEWLASLRRVRAFDAFSLHDPGPLVLTIQNKIMNRVRKLLRT
jgi:predicted ATP-grasp superfamily ATP-dependent carboligase